VSTYTKIPRRRLRYYPEIYLLITQKHKERFRQKQEDLLRIFDQIIEEEPNINRQEMLKLLGFSRISNSNPYQKLQKKIEELPDSIKNKTSFEERNAYYISKVKRFLENNEGRKITQEEIASYVGISSCGLKKYPDIQKVFRQIIEDNKKYGSNKEQLS